MLVHTLTQHHRPTKVPTYMFMCTLTWSQHMYTYVYTDAGTYTHVHTMLTRVHTGTCPPHMITEISHKYTQGHMPTHT